VTDRPTPPDLQSLIERGRHGESPPGAPSPSRPEDTSLNELIRLALEFHGFPVPGAIIGVFMADWAIELMPEVKRMGAVIESWLCLPSGIHTVLRYRLGKTQYRVVDLHKIACTFYDKDTGLGQRIYLDHRKLAPFPRIEAWYRRTLDHSLPKGVRWAPVCEEALRARRKPLTARAVRMTVRELGLETPVVECAGCGELFLSTGGDRCRGCDGGAYCEAAEGSES